MVAEAPFRITNASGDEIRGDVRWRTGDAPRKLIIVCHGFTAHKDWGPFPYFGRKFAELGFASIVFNFSHNGIGANFKRFTEIDKFSRNTIAKELEDLRAVIDAVRDGRIGTGGPQLGPVGIVGHSRGGGIGILAAREDPRIRAVAAWATIATFHRYTAHQRETWVAQGFLPISLKSYRTRLRYGIEMLRDLEANAERYDMIKAARDLRVPLLLVHGAADASVRVSEARALYDAAGPSKAELVVLEHTGHAFGAAHPFGKPGLVLEHVTEITAKWFDEHLEE